MEGRCYSGRSVIIHVILFVLVCKKKSLGGFQWDFKRWPQRQEWAHQIHNPCKQSLARWWGKLWDCRRSYNGHSIKSEMPGTQKQHQILQNQYKRMTIKTSLSKLFGVHNTSPWTLNYKHRTTGFNVWLLLVLILVKFLLLFSYLSVWE